MAAPRSIAVQACRIKVPQGFLLVPGSALRCHKRRSDNGSNYLTSLKHFGLAGKWRSVTFLEQLRCLIAERQGKASTHGLPSSAPSEDGGNSPSTQPRVRKGRRTVGSRGGTSRLGGQIADDLGHPACGLGMNGGFRTSQTRLVLQNCGMPETEMSMIAILLACCAGLLVLTLVLFSRISRRLARIEVLVGQGRSRQETGEIAPSAAERSPGGAFETFLNEDPARRDLPKAEQFTAYRQWRHENGMNWSNS